MGRSERGRTSRALAVALAVGLTAVLGSAPARSQGDDGECRISGGYAALFHDVALPDGTFAYRGVMIMRTHACGDGPKGIDGSFRPLVGTPAKCTPVETPRIDESRCSFEGVIGVLALSGSPVVVQATGHTSGINNDHVHDDDTLEKLQESRLQPNAVIKSAECVLELPEDGGQRACTLF